MHCAIATVETGQKIETLLSEDAGKYIQKYFSAFFSANVISDVKLYVYTSRQGSLDEMLNYTLLGMVRSMLSTSGLETSLGEHAVVMAVYLRKRVTTRLVRTSVTTFDF